MPVVEVPGMGDVEFPDSMTADQIGAAIKAQQAPSTPALGIGPAPAQGWFDNAVEDLKHGTKLTAVGELLDNMGARGLYSGNSEKVGDFMGSGPLGLLRMGKGAAQLPHEPLQGVGNIVGGGLEAATIPSLMAGNPGGAVADTVEAGAGLLGKAAKLIPSSKRAAKALDEVAAVTNDVPVDVSKFARPAMDAQHLFDVTRAPRPAPLRGAYNAIQPTTDPMTFADSRLLQSAAGRLSTQERLDANPQMLGLTKQLFGGLSDANREAAASMGVGNKYQQAIDEYRRAQQAKDAAKAIAKWGVGAAGLGGAAWAVRGLLNQR